MSWQRDREKEKDEKNQKSKSDRLDVEEEIVPPHIGARRQSSGSSSNSLLRPTASSNSRYGASGSTQQKEVQREKERTRSLSAGVAATRQRERGGQRAREAERVDERDTVHSSRRGDMGGGDDLNEGMRLLRARSERGAAINGNDTSRSTGHNQVRSSSRTRS